MIFQWHALLPVKPTRSAKTRLRNATSDNGRHAQLVRAIQVDTLAAILSVDASIIAGVHLVGDNRIAQTDDDRIQRYADPDGGLNVALADTAASVQQRYPAAAIIALVADLPSLRARELLEVLRQAEAVPRAVVLDSIGTGTTMLTALAGRQLAPSFGTDSARLHQEGGAVALQAPPGARTDVDTPEDLRQCLRLGVGAHTAGMVAYLV